MHRLVPFHPETHAHLVEPVTKILHAAYAPLAQNGLHYVASHQLASKTLERLNEGFSFLIFHEQELAGTVSLYEGIKKQITCDYYAQPGVWLFGQFAIDPKLQGRGLGSLVMDFLETEAKNKGALELALDTSEKADTLIAMYQKRGFKIVSTTQWPDVNYRSLILSKSLR